MSKKHLSLFALFILIAVASFGFIANGFSGNSQTVIENATIEVFNANTGEEGLGAIGSPNVFYDMIFHSSVKYKTALRTVAQTGATSTITLTNDESGETVLLSATGTTIMLPDVDFSGANYRFQINGASANANFDIKSAEGDNIEGTLIVAGAVVDCAGEDMVSFITDGENVGDYFEVMSDGTNWLLGDSGVLTASKLTCSDPS